MTAPTTAPRQRRREDERGAVLPLVALAITALVVMTSFAVDLGRARLRARDLQAVADVAALDLARRLEPAGAEVVDGVHREAPAAAVARLEDELRASVGPRNGYAASADNSLVDVGWYDKATQTTTVWGRADPTVRPVNAAIVALDDTVDHLFRPSSTSLLRQAAAIAGKLIPLTPCVGVCGGTLTDGVAATQVGSYLAAIDQGLAARTLAAGADATCGGSAGLSLPGATALATLNCSISAAHGITTPAQALRITAVGYQGLADSTLTLGDLASRLTAGDVDQLLSSQVSRRDLLLAVAEVAQRDGNTSAATPLTAFASRVASTGTVQLGRFFDVGADVSDGAVAATRISALSLLAGSARVMNGENVLLAPFQVGPVAVGPLSVNASVEVALVELPQTAVGPARRDANGLWETQATTGQLRARFGLTFDVAGVGTVSLPVTVAIAEATSDLTGLRCGGVPSGDRDDLLGTTRGAAAYVGQLGDLRTAVATPSPTGAVNVGGVTATPLVTVRLDAAGNVVAPTLLSALTSVQVFGRSAAGVAGATEAFPDLAPNPSGDGGSMSAPLGATIGSTLLSNLQLSSTSALSGTVAQTVTSAVGLVLADLDGTILDPILSALGFQIAGADLVSPSSTCSTTPVP